MGRLGMAIFLLVAFASPAASASAIQIAPKPPASAAGLTLVAATKPRTKAQQCKALDRCRGRFTYCDDKVFSTMKPGPKRDAAHDACVEKYRTCIKKNFASTELLFIRWFWPGECPY